MVKVYGNAADIAGFLLFALLGFEKILRDKLKPKLSGTP
jgi:hypothetical protein